MVGVGISIGGEPAAYIVETHLSRFLEGQVCACEAPSSDVPSLRRANPPARASACAGVQDVNNVELMWDQMYRSSINYGRKGLTIQVRRAAVCGPDSCDVPPPS